MLQSPEPPSYDRFRTPLGSDSSSKRLTGNPAGLSDLDPEVLQEVRAAHRDGRLGYLAGAGLSQAIGLPSWNDFNLALLRHALPYHPELADSASHGHGRDHAALARIYLDQIQGHSLAAVDFARLMAGEDFHYVLRKSLYERPALQYYRPTEVHCALASLAASSTPPFPCIHTTNYDDLLERALAQVTRSPVAAVHAGHRRSADGPRVVHLHGYFPYAPTADENERDLARGLVAGESDYHLLSNDHVAWTNRELLSLLDARSTLIVGTSLTDPNLRRLLAHVSRNQDRHLGSETHYVVMQSRDVDTVVDLLLGRGVGLFPNAGEKRRRAVRPLAERACKILEENERVFWARQAVKIIHVDRYDRLNYLFRRIRFSDEEWDREHARLRADWARRHYGTETFDDPNLQSLGTAVLAGARDRLAASDLKMHGRIELNLFFPLADGRYRRVFSSVPGRAALAPRRFQARHDRFTIPEVERVLTLGEPVTSPKILDRSPLPDEPPFEPWYNSIEGVPFFDDQAGGIPVAVIQLCFAERGGASKDLDINGMIRLRGYLVGVIQSVVHALERFQHGTKIDSQRAR